MKEPPLCWNENDPHIYERLVWKGHEADKFDLRGQKSLGQMTRDERRSILFDEDRDKREVSDELGNVLNAPDGDDTN